MQKSLHKEQQSSSSSLPSSTNTRISATSSSSYQSSSEHYLPFVSIMNQSTIYRRHEARLARSYALKDDPRPAVLRVLSGLPITNMIVPPYQPEDSESHHKDHMPERQRQHHHHQLGDYSEETVFSTTSEEEQPHLALNTRYASNNSIVQPALQAMMAVGVGATVGEFVFGGHYQRKSVTSPFEFPSPQQHPSHNTMYSSLVRGNAAAAAANADSSSLGVQLVKTSSQQQARPTTLPSATTRVASSATLKPSTFIWRSASTTGLMFGSKVMTEQYLTTTRDNNSSKTFATSTLSSMIAGGVTGMVKIATELTKVPSSTSTRIMTQPQSIFQTTTPAITSTPSQILSRQIFAATLYFATYDTLTNKHNTSNTNETPSCASTPQILFAGATAGVVHATTLSILSQNRTVGQIVPMAVRAAPIHAMIFLAYESMRQGMKIQN